MLALTSDLVRSSLVGSERNEADSRWAHYNFTQPLFRDSYYVIVLGGAGQHCSAQIP